MVEVEEAGLVEAVEEEALEQEIIEIYKSSFYNNYNLFYFFLLSKYNYLICNFIFF